MDAASTRWVATSADVQTAEACNKTATYVEVKMINHKPAGRNKCKRHTQNPSYAWQFVLIQEANGETKFFALLHDTRVLCVFVQFNY